MMQIHTLNHVRRFRMGLPAKGQSGRQGHSESNKLTRDVLTARPLASRLCSTSANLTTKDGNGLGAKIQETNTGEGRVSSVERETRETSIFVKINIDGTGKCKANTGIPFLEHMLQQISSHGLFDIEVEAKGDLWIDDHHTTEDIALAFGQCLAQALGDRRGIYRFGDFTAPLDEALIHVVMDLSGRPHLSCSLDIPAQRVGNFDTELVEHFFESMSNTSGMTLHIRQLAGKNSHHIIESTFKAFARALRQACSYDARMQGIVASSKGVLTQK